MLLKHFLSSETHISKAPAPVKYSTPASSTGRQLSAAAAVNEAVISFPPEVQMEVRLLTRESSSTEGAVSNRLLKPSSLSS